MLVHRSKRQRYQIQAPLTSLIDIVFLLLVYFLLTTNFLAEEGIDVKLPHAAVTKPQTEQRHITVFVDGKGRAFLGAEEVDTEELRRRLAAMIGADGNRPVLIKADRSVMLERAVRVMDVARAAGAERLSLATERDS